MGEVRGQDRVQAKADEVRKVAAGREAQVRAGRTAAEQREVERVAELQRAQRDKPQA